MMTALTGGRVGDSLYYIYCLHYHAH